MRKDINFAKSVMQAEFEEKLKEKSIELYVENRTDKIFLINWYFMLTCRCFTSCVYLLIDTLVTIARVVYSHIEISLSALTLTSDFYVY